MSANRFRWLILLVAGLLLLGRPALADEPSAKDKKKAKKLVDTATAAKVKGDKLTKGGKDEQARKQYRVAALSYLEAYSLVEAPILLFKLSEIYQARGEYEWALAGYRTYLKLDPEGSSVDAAEAAAKELDARRVADFKAHKKPPEGDPEVDPTAVFDPLPPVVIEKPKPKPRPRPPKPRPKVIEPIEHHQDEGAGHPGRTLRWSGYASAGLGAVLLAVGFKYGIDASSASSDLSNKEGAWDLNDRNKITAGEKAEKNQILFTLLGTAAVGAGSALWWLGDRAERRAIKRERARAAVLPAPGGGALVTVGGRF
ncbi:MAG TPA: hypothetical protein VL172_01160 [Kofleriaceae bacterium]|nr:hypothetical protein [Kofleriaceae bacterium]